MATLDKVQCAIWKRCEAKPAPKQRHTVLCAWQQGNRWGYAVLVHWPDGQWTDECENEIEDQDLPDLWMEILPPSRGEIRRGTV